MHWLVRRRLVLPLFHGRKTPEQTARGTAIGLFVGYTPTVGIQMPMVLAMWALLRWTRSGWKSNLQVALAWTWVTNALTMVPVCDVFLATGGGLLGRADDARGFDAFREKMTGALSPDAGLLDTLQQSGVNLFDEFGLPLWAGSLPGALVPA